MNDFLDALRGSSSSSHQHTDECKNTQGGNCTPPEALRTIKKVKKMCDLSKEMIVSIWDRHAMLLSTFGICSEYWPSSWPNKTEHLAYLKTCHEATAIIVLCKDPAVVLDTWCNVKKPKECDNSTIGEAAQLLLDAVAKDRHWKLSVEWSK